MKRYPRSIVLVLIFCCLAAAVGAENTHRVMRISVENRAGHVQVRMLKRFVDRVKTVSADSLSIELYDDARLFRDADVIPALSQGKVEMALPGIWQLDRFSPDFAALMLPSVYGRSEADVARAVDSELGSYLSRSLEKSLPVVVLGRWMELGSAHTFFIGKSTREYRGLRIRVAGGAANEERVRAFGALPVSIPWPDFPSYVSRGLVDAVVTTYETILSANLNEIGIEAVMEESHYVGFYVPILNRRFWDSLDIKTREALQGAWEATVDEARAAAREAQIAAKKSLIGSGVTVRLPSSSESVAKRDLLLTSEREIAERVHVSEDGLERLHAAFGIRRK